MPQQSQPDRAHPAADGGRSVPVAVISAVDPVLRDALIASLLLDAQDAVALRYELVAESAALRRLIVSSRGVLEDELVDLDHPCHSCAMREDAVPTLERLARTPGIAAILLAPPLSAEPATVCGALRAQEDGWHLADAAVVLDAETAIHDLLGDDTLAERGLQWLAEDHRAVGEALAAQLEYAPTVVLEGDGAGAGAALIEHLRAPEQQLIEGIYALDARMLLSGRLDHMLALRRRDVRYVEPYGGPTGHGTWTLDLISERPFHPDRLLEQIEAIGAGHLRGRGRFWVPDRPDSICQWDGAGGQVAVGAVWRTRDDLPTTRLVVTGIHPEDRERVRTAFGRALLTEEEWADGLAPWLGCEDRLAPWLGERESAA